MGMTKLASNARESRGESQELLLEDSSEYRELGESQEERDGESVAENRLGGLSVKESRANWSIGTLSFLKVLDNDVLDAERLTAGLRRLLDEAADIERLTDLVVEVETVESIEDRRPLKLSRRYGNEIRTGSINLFVSERDWIGNSMGNYLTHLWSCFQRDEA